MMSSQDQEAASAQLIQELELLHRRLSEMDKLAAVHQEERKKLIRLNRFLKAIQKCNEALIYDPSEMDLMQEICRIIVEVGGYALAWVGQTTHDAAQTVQPVVKAGDEAGYLSKVRISWADNEHGRGPVGTCIRTGQPVALQNLSAEPGLAPWLQEAAQRGYQAVLAIPLLDKDKAFGALAIYAKEPEAFDPEEQTLLKELADDLAFGVVALRTQDERWQAELAAETARQERSKIFQAIGNPALILDENRQIISANKAMAAATGLSEAELVGKTCYEVLHTEAPQDCPVEQVLSSPSAKTTERVAETLGGVFLVSCTPEYNEAGQLWRIIVIAADITERKRAEEALRESEAKYKSLIDNFKDIIFTIDLKGKITFTSQSIKEILGYESAETINMNILDFIPEEDRRKALETLPQGMEGEKITRYQTQAITKSGERVFLELTFSRLYKDGVVVGAQAIAKNITERKRAEAELSQYRDHLQELVEERTAQLQSANRLLEAEITERKRAEDELRKHRDHLEELVTERTSKLKASQARLVEAQAVAQLGSWEWDAVKDEITGSVEFYRLFGVEREKIANFSQFIGLLHVNDRERVQRDVAEALEQSRPYDTDYRVMLPDNQWRHIHARGKEFVDENGKPLRMVGTCMDITDRKRAEEELKKHRDHLEELVEERTTELRESERRTRAIIQTALEGFWISDLQGHFLDVNDSYCRMIGYSREELLRMSIPDVEAIEEPEETVKRIKHILEHGYDRFESRHRRKDGKMIDLEISATYSAEGGEQLIVFLRDISERKRAEKQILWQNQVMEAINAVFEEALICDTEEKLCDTCLSVAEKLSGSKFGFIGELNPAGLMDTIAISDPGWDACQMTVAEARKVIVNMLIRGIDRSTLREGKARIVSQSEFAGHPDRVGAPEGHPPLTAFLGVPLKQEKKTIGMIGLGNKPGGYDLNDQQAIEALAVAIVQALERKRMEIAVKKFSAQLEEANRELSAFSYSVSHDLRSPLRAIQGFSKILLEDYSTQLDQQGQHYLDVVSTSTRQMGTLIDDLLTLSRLGRAEMTLSEIDMKDLAQAVFRELQRDGPERKLELVIHDLAPARGDRSLIRQVLVNLVSNAIKYTRPREVGVIQVGSRKEKDETIFYVQDNGVGFNPKYKNKLFGVFQRLHSAEEFEGTGVGLAIVQRIVLRHGGRVWAEGKVGEGAAFFFTLGSVKGTRNTERGARNGE